MYKIPGMSENTLKYFILHLFHYCREFNPGQERHDPTIQMTFMSSLSTDI